MRTLVVGGTGKVGRGVVSGLQARDVEAVSASRGGGDGIAVDLTDAEALTAAARGFDAAFLITPLGPDEARIGVAAVRALRAAGVDRIVHLGIHNLEAMAEIPHFACKVPIKQEVLSDGRSTVIEANFFFQNDLLFLGAIKAGVYPLPIGEAGVFSVDAADIAAAGVTALLDPRWRGRAAPVCGPDRLTGPDLAANWSAAIGRPVVYGGDAIEPFLAGLAHAMPGMDPWLRHDFEVMMRVTQSHGCPATPQDLADARALIGRTPRSHRDFTQQRGGP